MTIDAVLFDYSGVLTTPLHLPTENVPYDPDAVLIEMIAALSGTENHPWHELERGEISLDEYVDVVEEKVPGAGVLFAVDTEFNVMKNLELIQDRLDTARELKALGVRVGVVTNNVAEWQPLWRPRLPADLFDLIVDSADVGCRKPEPAIYELALEKLNVSDPQSVLFIDDFEWNVTGAQTVGMQALHCSAETDLRSEIAVRV